MNPSPSKLRILVVDDDPGILQILNITLEASGFIVTQAEYGSRVLEAVRLKQTDLILLDLGLPDIDGLQVIKRIRYAGATLPIIVMSSRTDEIGKVNALDLGADDYVEKPFSFDELIARIRVLQRYRVQAPLESVIVAGALRINTNSRTVTVHDREVKVSAREYTLLRLLAVHAGKVLTHGFIIRNVWGSGSDIQYLRIYISSLRRKIERDPAQPKIIVTEQGVGYSLSTNVPRSSANSVHTDSDSSRGIDPTLSR